MKRWFVWGVILVVGLAGISCSRKSPREAGRLTVDGRVEVTTAEGGQRSITDSLTLRSGEQVRVVEGTATLGLGRGGQLELRQDAQVVLAVIEGSDGDVTRGELVTGDVLVSSADDAPAEVVAGDTTVEVTGVARVSRRLAVVVATYQGMANLESVTKEQLVPALRQVTVPAPGLPSRPTPLQFAAADPWDQRYLGDAVDLGNQLVARGRGFTAQIGGGQDTGEAFLRQILPALRDQPFDASLLDTSQPVGDALVGAAITLEGTKGEFRERWMNVFGFHRDGAQWGIVALDQGVARQPLLAAVDAATGRVPSLGPQAATPSPTTGVPAPVPVPIPTTVPAGPAGSELAAPPAGSGGSGGPGGGGGGVSADNGSPSASGPAVASDTPDSGPVNLGVPVVDNTVNSVVDLLTGLLRSIGGETP